MIEDLKLIQKHKYLYVDIMEKIFSKLLTGEKNRKKAIEIYKQKEEEMRKISIEEQKQRLEYYKRLKESINVSSEKEKVKKLIYEIKNNN